MDSPILTQFCVSNPKIRYRSAMSKTKSNTAYSWPQNDKLERYKDADILLRFISGKLEQRAKAGLTRSYVLNLDAQWGSGKTFFLKNLKEKISANGQVAIYIDAWQDDHSNDPFIAVISGIQEEIDRVIENNDSLSRVKNAVLPVTSSTLKILGSGLKSGMLHMAKKKIGEEALKELGELLNRDEKNEVIKTNKEAILKFTDTAIDATGTAILSGFSASKQARTSFRENLEDLTRKLESHDPGSMPVFVLIDELDRCRPSYAIELLEEVKHLFNVENMVFILGTDTEQLAHAVSGVYGSGFDGRRYLSRFIDRTYQFRETNINSFVEHCLQMHGLSDSAFGIPDEIGVSQFLSQAFEHCNASLRYIEQIIDYLATFTATWEHKTLKINLILLFELAIKAHPESARSPDQRYLALGAHYTFRTYSRNMAYSDKDLNIEDMLFIIKEYSKNFDGINDANNSFERWAYEIVRNEIVFMNTLNKNRDSGHRKGIAEEYPRMFHDMLSVHDAFAYK